MTLQEAKDQVATKYNRSSFYALLCLTLQPSEQLDLINEVMELYARSKWDQACEAMRVAIIDQWQPDAGEFESINDTTFPEFKP